MRTLLLFTAAALAACGGEPLLHGLDEPQANEVLVALDERGIGARKRRDDATEGGWVITVGGTDAARARRVLAERELPRPRPPGFGDVFTKASMVPTPTEEHVLYLHALAGELARTVEALDGVVGARVHLGLPQPDPLRPGARQAPRAAVLVRCRPAACEAVRALEPGVRAIVAGAADGLDADGVAVVVSEAAEAAPRAAPPKRSTALLVLAGVAGLGAAALAATAAWARVRRPGAA